MTSLLRKMNYNDQFSQLENFSKEANMSTQPVSHFNDILREWQSPTMIPVVLQLLNEELNYLEGRHKASSAVSTLNIQAYQRLYRHWEKDQTLNQKQKGWIREMGGYLNILNQTIFNTPSKNNLHSANQTEKSSFELKI
jgi:hypothetical protein